MKRKKKKKEEPKKLRIKDLIIINGGKERNDSSQLALKYLKKFKPSKVFIHDAARPNFSIKLLKKISKENTLYDTVITIANEELVKLFLQHKISLRQIVENLTKIINLKEYKKYFSKKSKGLTVNFQLF